MDFLEILSTDSYRATADAIVEKVGWNQEYFNQLVDYSLTNDYPVAMRAARAAQLCAEKHPSLAVSNLERIIDFLPQAKIDGVKRCYIKLFTENVAISELEKLHNLGILLDLGFQWVLNPKEAIAIRAFSLYLLNKLAKIEPDIDIELLAVLENTRLEDSPGMISVKRKLIPQIRKRIK